MAGKAWWQEGEEAGHMAPTIRKQRGIRVNAEISFMHVDRSLLWDISSGAHRPEVSDALRKLELQEDVSCSTWALEPELWSSARATHTLNR